MAPMSAFRYILYQYVSPTIAALMILTNLLKIYVIKRQRTRITMAMIFLVNVSISDILVGTIMLVIKLMNPFFKTSLKNNAFAIEFNSILKLAFIRISLFLSVLNLVALTCDRMLAIKKPFVHRKYGKSFAVKICIGIWIFSIVCVSCLYLFVRYYAETQFVYMNLVFPAVSYPATIIFVVCYTQLFYIVRKSSIMKRKATTCHKKKEGKEVEDGVQKAEIKIAILAIKIVAAFCICFLPMSTRFGLAALNIKTSVEVGGAIFQGALCHGVISPVIYICHSWKSTAKARKRAGTLNVTETANI